MKIASDKSVNFFFKPFLHVCENPVNFLSLKTFKIEAQTSFTEKLFPAGKFSVQKMNYCYFNVTVMKLKCHLLFISSSVSLFYSSHFHPSRRPLSRRQRHKYNTTSKPNETFLSECQFERERNVNLPLHTCNCSIYHSRVCNKLCLHSGKYIIIMMNELTTNCCKPPALIIDLFSRIGLDGC